MGTVEALLFKLEQHVNCHKHNASVSLYSVCFPQTSQKSKGLLKISQHLSTGSRDLNQIMCFQLNWRHTACGHTALCQAGLQCKTDCGGVEVVAFITPTQCGGCLQNPDTIMVPHDVGKAEDMDCMVDAADVFDRLVQQANLNHNPGQTIDLTDRDTLQGLLAPENFRLVLDVYKKLLKLFSHDCNCPPQVSRLFFSAEGPTDGQMKVAEIIHSVVDRNPQATLAYFKSPRGRLTKFFLRGGAFPAQGPPIHLDPDEYATMIRRILTPRRIEDLELDARDCSICFTTFGTPIDRADGKQHRYEIVELPVALPCGHVFGRGCVEKVLMETSYECPYRCGEYRWTIGDMAMQAAFPRPWWLGLIVGEDNLDNL